MKSFLVAVVLLGLTAFALGHPRSFHSRSIMFSNGKHIDTLTHPSIEYEASGHTQARKRFGDAQKQQYLVHFAKPISNEQREDIERKIGQSLGAYMPHHTYLLYSVPSVAERAASLSEVHWVGRFSSEYKFSQNFNENLQDRMTVLLPPSSNDADKVAEEYRRGLRAAGLEVNDVTVVSENRLELSLPVSRQNAARVASWVAEQPSSHFLEPVSVFTKQTQEASKIIESGYDTFVPKPFSDNNIVGRGQVVGLADTGIRNDHCMFNDGTGVNVGGYNANAYKIVTYNTTYGDSADADGHGTLVAGIVAGYTTTVPAANFTGIAHGAQLYFSDISTTGSTLNPPSALSRLFDPARAVGAATYLLPFGSAADWYTSDSASIDSYMRTNDDFLVVVPSGNNGPLGKLTSFAYSKNALVVGSSISTQEGALQDLPAQDFGPIFLNPSLFQPYVLSTSSSRGPTADGRIKPDVVAPGQRIKSASNSGACAVNSNNGTSLSAAVVTGAAAMIREYLSRGFYPTGIAESEPFTPTASLIKAILINSGTSLSLADSNGKGNWVNLNDLYPSGYQGFGRVQLNTGLFLANYTSLTTNAAFRTGTVGTGQQNRLCFNVIRSLPFLKATLVWTDAAASPASGHILINDLDLVIVDSTGRTWKTNTADGGFDAFNNVEQVMLANPAQGQYSIHVFGRAVPTGTQQSYSLVVSGPDFFTFDNCDSFPPNVCPNSCNMIGTCTAAGSCTCPSGREGVDCSIIPCPVTSGLACSGNGVCDYATSTCVCGPQYVGTDCSTVRPSTTNDTQSLPVQIQYISGDGKISVGMLVGIAVGAFILGTIISIVLGAFIAVKYLEYKRDRAQQDREEEMD